MTNSTPPFIRGTGTLLILTAAVIAFAIARNHQPLRNAAPAPPAIKSGGDDLAKLAGEVRELRAEVNEEKEEGDVVDEVLDNSWFECIGFAGTALIGVSFYAEAYLRREKKDPRPKV